MSKIGVGIIGGGAIAEIVHLPAYYEEKNQVEIVGICDINEKRAQDMAKKFGAKAWYTDYRMMLQRKDLDAVSICTPNYLHCEQAVAAADAGKHILLEKPMALTLEECDKIIDACKKANVKLLIGAFSKFDPVNEKLKQIIDEGIIGRILQIKYHIAYSGPYEAWPAVSEWFFDASKAGGGCLIDAGSHYVSLFKWLGGEISSVYATGGTLVKNIEGEDNAMVLLTFKNGAMGELDISWTYKGSASSAEILGTEGGVFIGFPSSALTVYTTSGIPNTLKGFIQPQLPTTISEMMAFQKRKVRHFIESIRADEETIESGQDGRSTLEVILAAYESMKTGKKVDLRLGGLP
jgi:predicted dehydrogenase